MGLESLVAYACYWIDTDQAGANSGGMTRPYFFGYGSLVNRKTHTFTDMSPATLTGWRRVWRQTTYAPRPILTIEPCAGVTVSGVIAHVPNDDWSTLDAREHAYDRVALGSGLSHASTAPSMVATYSIPTEKFPQPTKPRPIHLSYLDVVIQGYLTEFDEATAMQFFATTVGWDAPIKDDRHNPAYPRHQSLTKGERAFVDKALAETRRREALSDADGTSP